jgi:ferric-dicitrate binding protein FerR (iron transport regulator)
MDFWDQRLFILLDRYVAGDASAAEAGAVRDWLADDPAHAALLEDLRMIKRVAAERPPDSSVDAAWAKALEQLQSTAAPRSMTWRVVPPRPAPRPRASRGPAWVGLAAAVVLALVGSVLRRTPPWRDFATDAAHRLVIRLRDGTQVTLAPRSHLRYQADYGATGRDLHVEGQAYFQVAHDAARPFRVHTRGSVAEALGTAFAVSAYGDQVATEVVVAQGRVALWQADTASRTAAPRAGAQPAPYASRTGPALVLAAGDLGRLDPSGAATIQRGVDVERYVAWTRGVLVFDGTPLGEVVRVLERWYDVEIHLADNALGARRLTATFRDEPLDLVLARIALTLGLRVERADRSVLLVRKRR